jgi:hypothetical protein
MKNIFYTTAIIIVLLLQVSCKSQMDISPRKATVLVPAKGELRLFENSEHYPFSIQLINRSLKNSCEAFTVKNDSEKWISPSLLANDQLAFNVGYNGSVLLKNFSKENIYVTYIIH